MSRAGGRGLRRTRAALRRGRSRMRPRAPSRAPPRCPARRASKPRPPGLDEALVVAVRPALPPVFVEPDRAQAPWRIFAETRVVNLTPRAQQLVNSRGARELI